jgi:hypothetical protein
MKDDLTVWLGAFRYYCGRTSYAVDDYCRALCAEWPILTEYTRFLIQTELEKEFERDDAERQEDIDMEKKVRRTKRYPLGLDDNRRSWEKVRQLWRV